MSTAPYFVYYYDRIRIHSILDNKTLSQLIDTGLFKGHCKKIIIDKASNLLRMRGYYGKIEIYQATDEAIRILQGYDILKHVISYMEVTGDLVCNNDLMANKYKQLYQWSRYLKWGKGAFSIEDTDYIGKLYKIKRNFYVRCYVPAEDNIKLGHRDVAHVEFSISKWEIIKRKLEISSIYDLTNADNYYRYLTDKYIVKGTLNKVRIQKYFPDFIVKYINEFIPVLAWKKNVIGIKKKRIIVRRILRGEVVSGLSRSEQLIINQSARYWIKEKDGGRI